MEDVVVVTKNDQDKKDELCNFLEQAWIRSSWQDGVGLTFSLSCLKYLDAIVLI
jgi:hypothetical protein